MIGSEPEQMTDEDYGQWRDELTDTEFRRLVEGRDEAQEERDKAIELLRDCRGALQDHLICYVTLSERKAKELLSSIEAFLADVR